MPVSASNGRFNNDVSQKCDEIQGFLFSPPVSEKEFTELLRKESAAVRSKGRSINRKSTRTKAGKLVSS